MSNINWSQLPSWVGSIDIANDLVAVWKNSNSTLYKATPNQLANLASQWVGINDTQTLTAKTLTSPNISGPVLSGTITGTYIIGGTPTFPSSVVTLTGTQTLTNKTLTSPTISSPSITNATITADTISGYTSGSSGTIYGMSVTSGVLASAALAGAVNGAALATNAITLGYAQITSNFTTTSASATQVTGLSATVTIPSGGRKVKISVFCGQLIASGGTANVTMSLWDGPVGSGTELSVAQFAGATATLGAAQLCMAVVSPSAGSKTYNVGLATSSNTGSLNAGSVNPAFILVEAI